MEGGDHEFSELIRHIAFIAGLLLDICNREGFFNAGKYIWGPVHIGIMFWSR